MTSRSSDPANEQRTELIAYLDGEVDEARAQDIETRISDDDEVRDEVDRLQRTYDLLDLLPLAKADNAFTTKTLESIAVERVESKPRGRDWGIRVRRAIVAASWLLGLTLAVLVGFATTNRWVETDTDLLVRDYPVIDNLDLYTDVGSVEFLDQLRESGLLADEDEGSHVE